MKNIKLRKLIGPMLLIMSLSMLLSACSNSPSISNEVSANPDTEEQVQSKDKDDLDEVSKENEDSYYPVTYTTYNYAKEQVEVTIEKAPERVVAVYQNSIETLLALGLEDKVVAAAGLDHKVKDELVNSFEKLNYLEKWQPAKETILMLEPDFILSWKSYFGDKHIGDVDYYHDNNIGTYIALNSGVVSNRTLENECNDILTLGKIFNVNEKASEIVSNINNRVSEVSELAKGEEQRSVLLIEFSGDQILSYGSSSLGGDMVEQLGAKLLSKEGNPLGLEDLIALDPDSIFVVYFNGGERSDEEAELGALNSILGNEALKNLDAVKNNNVYAIPLGEMYASGIRTIDGIERLARGIYE